MTLMFQKQQKAKSGTLATVSQIDKYRQVATVSDIGIPLTAFSEAIVKNNLMP